jgi:hypothetical protein
MASDPVNHPPHYTNHPSGIECIQITEHMGFCLGNAVKYLWRADLKGDAVEDLRKAVWYIEREIQKRTKHKGTEPMPTYTCFAVNEEQSRRDYLAASPRVAALLFLQDTGRDHVYVVVEDKNGNRQSIDCKWTAEGVEAFVT